MARMSIEEFRAMMERANKPTRAKRARPKNLEHDTQVRCVAWMRDNYPQYEPYFWATPNGGYRAKRTAIMMKAEGMKAGVPDLQLAYPSRGWHGLFIEMKKSSIGKKGQLIGKGKASEAQADRMEALRNVGYRCEICYTYEQFKEIIRDYLTE